jgi:predicted RNA-binding Zn ribbon-like protein
MGDVARMERIGGHAAVDFVNTLGGRPDDPDDEYLFNYAGLLAFTHGSGLLEPVSAERLDRAAERLPGQAREVLDRALHLRGCLDRILRAHLNGRQPRADDLDTVRDTYITALMHGTLQPTGERYDWTWNRGSEEALDEPLRPLAAHAVELLRSAPLDRLNQCGHCRWLFLDTSKNHSRRWCSMTTCGSITKMRRYRATRRLAARSATTEKPL